MIELQIGDSPFPSTEVRPRGRDGGHRRRADALLPVARPAGVPRDVIAETVRAEFGIPAGPENVVVGPGAKVFEQFFCELFLEPGDAVLVF